MVFKLSNPIASHNQEMWERVMMSQLHLQTKVIYKLLKFVEGMISNIISNDQNLNRVYHVHLGAIT